MRSRRPVSTLSNRKVEVAEIAIQLIAELGLERVSVRLIAERAGYSTAIVSHHFKDKHELLLLAFERTLEQSVSRAEAAIAAGQSAASILEQLLPLDEAGQREWKILFAFWNRSLSHPDYRHIQLQRANQARTLIRRVLDECSDVPAESVGGRDLQTARIYAMIGGVALQSIYDPDPWPIERQRQLIEGELNSLRQG